MKSIFMTRRRTKLFTLLLAVLFTLSPVSVLADVGSDDIVMVVNARNPTRNLSKGQIKNIYLGNVAFWNGVVPVALFTRPPDHNASQHFYESMLRMNAQRFDSHWTSRQLAGKGVAPVVIGSPDELAEHIRASPGAIGFMLASEVWGTAPDGIRVVELN